MCQCVEEKSPVTMEHLPINDGSGQSFGFVLYRKQVVEPKKLMFPGKVSDRAVVSQMMISIGNGKMWHRCGVSVS